MLKKIYLSPLGYFISLILNLLAGFHRPFMVYGFYNRVTKKFMKHTRISSSTKFLNRNLLDIEDNVWIGHFSILDASNGIYIGEGVQTGSHISIYSHSSHNSVRLLGRSYLESDERVGYVKGSVSIGEFSFIGDSCVIFPNVTIGRACLIKAGSVVTESMPELSIVEGVPAKVVGSVIDIDKRYFSDAKVKMTYFDKSLIPDID
jgi:acetyltransferase-like isoleucine patch superfamily enzyme